MFALESEMEIVRWYTQVMEEEGSTKHIVKNYLKLKQVLKQSKLESEKRKVKYEKEFNETKQTV